MICNMSEEKITIFLEKTEMDVWHWKKTEKKWEFENPILPVGDTEVAEVLKVLGLTGVALAFITFDFTDTDRQFELKCEGRISDHTSESLQASYVRAKFRNCNEPYMVTRCFFFELDRKWSLETERAVMGPNGWRDPTKYKMLVKRT